MSKKVASKPLAQPPGTVPKKRKPAHPRPLALVRTAPAAQAVPDDADARAGLRPPALPREDLTCTACGAVVGFLRNDRCLPCDAAANAAPTVEPSTETHDVGAEATPAPAPATDTPPATNAFSAKVAALVALVQQGEDAIAEALRNKTVSIRVPRPQVAPTGPIVVRHPTAGVVARNRAAGLETARTIRARYTAGEDLKALGEEFGIRMGTMYDIVACRVYREKQA